MFQINDFEGVVRDTQKGRDSVDFRQRPHGSQKFSWGLQPFRLYVLMMNTRAKARFANAANFTFIFVGSFTPAAIRPLVKTYLASLPASAARESWRDLGITAPIGVIERTMRKGSSRKPRSRSSSPAVPILRPTSWRCE